MSHSPRISLIQEHRWSPLVFISPQHQALIVTPGIHPDGLTLKSGWLWHWPVLTSVIEFSQKPYQYRFYSQANQQPGSDQSITAVSRDHQLLTIEGHIDISVDLDAPTSILSRLNRHTHDRVIRPVIRQVIRERIGQLEADKCNPSQLQSKIGKDIKEVFKLHSLVSQNFTIISIKNYTPDIKTGATVRLQAESAKIIRKK